MKSQQIKCLLAACNPLFLFTPCSALIDLRRGYISTVCLKSLLQRNKNIIMSSFKSSGDIQKKEGGPDSCFG